jgi:hypothetical protein
VFPFHLLLVALLGWVEREQCSVIDFLREENRVLKAQLRGHRIRLTDDQRRRLAVLGHQIGRRALRHIATLATPDTILRWHRQLGAEVDLAETAARPTARASRDSRARSPHGV